MKKRFWVGIILVLTVCTTVTANDSAASTAAGGIQLRREPRIAMMKEKLTISIQKVTVEYEFLNESNQDIDTEIAFPIPAYALTFSAGGTRPFDDFKVWVQGKELKYQIDAKALLNGRDYTGTLRRFGVDVASLGHYDHSQDFSEDFRKLTPSQKQTLMDAGLFDSEDQHLPQWSVEKIYHWRQFFPAHKVIHVRHEYQPGAGFRYAETSFLNRTARNAEVQRIKSTREKDEHGIAELASVIDSTCMDRSLEESLIREGNGATAVDKGLIRMMWVDYILTTANNWKMPIGQFELVVEGNPQILRTSLCWDGKFQRKDATHFSSVVKDFVPRKELRIGFFWVNGPAPETEAPSPVK
jgi:hypothetical protein